MNEPLLAPPVERRPPDKDGRWVDATEYLDALEELERCRVPWDAEYDAARAALELAGVWAPAAVLRQALEARRMLRGPLCAALWLKLV